MNTELQKRALAARDAHLALLDLKKFVDEAAQTTHAAELEAVHLAIRPRPTENISNDTADSYGTSGICGVRRDSYEST